MSSNTCSSSRTSAGITSLRSRKRRSTAVLVPTTTEHVHQTRLRTRQRTLVKSDPQTPVKSDRQTPLKRDPQTPVKSGRQTPVNSDRQTQVKSDPQPAGKSDIHTPVNRRRITGTKRRRGLKTDLSRKRRKPIKYVNITITKGYR